MIPPLVWFAVISMGLLFGAIFLILDDGIKIKKKKGRRTPSRNNQSK